MANSNKKTALFMGAVFIVIAVLLLGRRAMTTIYQNSTAGDVTLGGVDLPQLRIDVPRVEFSMPAFALPPDQFSMIAGCCSDCSSKSGKTTSYLPANYGNTYVFNEGNTGGAVYNIYEAPKTTVTSRAVYGAYGVSSRR